MKSTSDKTTKPDTCWGRFWAWASYWLGFLDGRAYQLDYCSVSNAEISGTHEILQQSETLQTERIATITPKTILIEIDEQDWKEGKIFEMKSKPLTAKSPESQQIGPRRKMLLAVSRETSVLDSQYHSPYGDIYGRDLDPNAKGEPQP